MGKSSKRKTKKEKGQSAEKLSTKETKKSGRKNSPKKINGFKVFIMHFVTIVSIVLFVNLPLNKRWLNERVSQYLKVIPEQMNNLDVATRKKNKYGFEYTITNYLKKNLTPKDTLLVPPQPYLISKSFNKIKSNHFWVMPRVFYYHSNGIMNVEMKNADSIIARVTHAMYVDENSQIKMMKIKNEQTLNRLTSMFDQYEMRRFWSLREAYKYYKKENQ